MKEFRNNILAIAAVVIALPLQAQTVKINIADAQFTRPLIETLAKEYAKQNPSFSAEFTSKADSSDATVDLSEAAVSAGSVVARFVVLPIANTQSPVLTEKKVQRGVTAKVSHQLFAQPTTDELIDGEAPKALPGTVYTLTGKYATTTRLLANSLSIDPKELRGKKILGKEENAITVVKARPDAVSVGVASLVYDPTTRRPVDGITVLPVDLDGNNRVSDEERAAAGNLDALTTILSSVNRPAVPVGDISISTTNPEVEKFICWAATDGQDYLSLLGYLRANPSLIAKK